MSGITNESAAVIGAGLIGRGWAIVFARAGWNVTLYDNNADALAASQHEIENQLQLLRANGLCEDPDSTKKNISYQPKLADAVRDVDYVQECGPESVDIKKALFSELDQLTPTQAVLASSSSGLMTSEFAEHLDGRHRTLVVHPVNPPHLVPLVEISPASWTDETITQRAYRVMESVKQSPITVQKEIPGFILNRLQGALLNEALRMVQGGYATPDDVDKTVRDGLGLRWSFMGPFETIDLNAPGGVADYAARYGQMYETMAESQATAPGWSADAVADIVESRSSHLQRDNILQRQNWRDDRLAALVAHKGRQKQP
jgi:3-hydroxyacyl-CoA dehydrogenase